LVLDEENIIQIDATVIAGILILLTVSSFASETQTKPTFLDALGGINDATAIIITPFAFSAIISISMAFSHESYQDLEKLRALRESKIERLKMQFNEEKNSKNKNKIERKIKKLQKKVEKAKKKMLNYDEESRETEYRTWRARNFASMIIGFVYLLIVIMGIAFS